MNSFNLTTALYDRLGLYQHPYASLINHSCDYNSIVGFDGDELFIKAIKPIKKDQQIFISYIDATNVYEIRQRELSERYYFECRCFKCEREVSSSNKEGYPPAVLQEEKKAYHTLTTMEAASSEESESPQHQQAITENLITAMQELRQAYTTTTLPITTIITQQPYVSLRDELITSLLSTGSFSKAFLHSAIRYIHIDPIIYPYESHPIRQIHAFTLAKLIIHLSQADTNTNTNPETKLEHSMNTPKLNLNLNLNLNIILLSILYRLMTKQPKSCTVPGFKHLVGVVFRDVSYAFSVYTQVQDMDYLNVEIDREWGKLRDFLGGELERGV